MFTNGYVKNSSPAISSLCDIPLTDWSRPREYLYILNMVKNKGIAVDVGCGRPDKYPLPFALTEKYTKVYGIDPLLGVEDGIVLNRVEYRNEKACSMSFDDDSVDAVFCISVLEHFKEKDIESSVKEFNRILKKGGYLYLSFMVSNDITKNSPPCNFLEHQLNGKGIFCGDKYGPAYLCKKQVTPKKMLRYFQKYFEIDGPIDYDKDDDILTSANRLTFCCRLKKKKASWVKNLFKK